MDHQVEFQIICIVDYRFVFPFFCWSHLCLTGVCVVEDQLIVSLIGNDGAAMQFRLAPAYTLYMVLRACISSPRQRELGVLQQDQHVNSLASRVTQYLHQIVQVNFSFCTATYHICPVCLWQN